MSCSISFCSTQERSNGTSSVAFEVLIINCQIGFINLFIFNCITLDINLFIFNCLTPNFYFPKIISFARRRERLLMDTRPWFRILNSPGKMMTCYLWDTSKFLRYHTLCTSMLKCGFPTKGIKLTQFVLFEVLGGPNQKIYVGKNLAVKSSCYGHTWNLSKRRKNLSPNKYFFAITKTIFLAVV